MAHPGPVATDARCAGLLAAGVYSPKTVLAPIRVGRRNRAPTVCRHTPAWLRHAGAAREDGPDAFRAVAYTGLRVSPTLASSPCEARRCLGVHISTFETLPPQGCCVIS